MQWHAYPIWGTTRPSRTRRRIREIALNILLHRESILHIRIAHANSNRTDVSVVGLAMQALLAKSSIWILQRLGFEGPEANPTNEAVARSSRNT